MRGPVSFLHEWDPAGKQSLRARPEGPCFGEADSVYWRWHRTLSSVGSERTPHTRKVAGSTPAASTTILYVLFVRDSDLLRRSSKQREFPKLTSALIDDLPQSLQPQVVACDFSITEFPSSSAPICFPVLKFLRDNYTRK